MCKNQEIFNKSLSLEKKLKEDFEKADLNNDGFIEITAFASLLNNYNIRLISTYDIDRCFADHNRIKDGLISLDGKT